MNGYTLPRFVRSPRATLAVLASTAMLTAGCANMASTATDVSPVSSAATVSGKVHGGNQAVSGATVTINFAGQTGLRSASTVAATTTTSTDGTGSFSFLKDPNNGTSYPSTGNTFSCPSGSSDPLVYLVAKGGNTVNDGSSNVNNAAVFIAPLGTCNELAASTVYMSEATTVATIAALQQYFDPISESIGADGIGAAKQAIINSFALVSNMVDLSTGLGVASVTHSGANAGNGLGVAAVTVTSTPELAKINTIANIISACVNNATSSATACSTLFASAVPPAPSVTGRAGTFTFPAATDVLQAAYYMLVNPTNSNTTNLQALYGLAPAVGAPYQPTLTAVPSDWTIGINYATTSTCGTGVGNFISGPADIGIDINGAVWIANGQAGTGNLSQITAIGTPQTCLFVGGGAMAGGVLDDSPNLGKVWVGTSGNNIYRYDPATHASLAFPTAEPALAIVADGKDNVYFSGASGSLYMITGGATATAAVTPVQISSVIGTANRLFIDNSTSKGGAIWATSGSSFVSSVSPAISGANLLNGYNTVTFNVGSPTYGVVTDIFSASSGTNNVYVSSSSSSNFITKLNGSGSSYTVVNGWPTATGAAGLNSPTGLAVDGSISGTSNGNLWSANNSANTTSGLFSVSEISAAKASLSPDGNTAGGFQKSTPFLAAGRAIAVDQSGNVWLANDGATSVTEIVGAGVPLYQPFAAGLYSGRFLQIP